MAALALKSIQLSTFLAAALALATPALAGDVSVKLDAGTGFSVKDSTGTVERLRVDEATGNISRNGALFVHTTGANSLFVGEGAGNTGATSGLGWNSAFGSHSLHYNTGGRNSAFGAYALFNNTAGSANTAMGAYALISNTTGTSNTASGTYALWFNTTGFSNTAIGMGALRSNTTGVSNTATGFQALRDTSGSRNVAIGSGAGSAQTTGNDNIYLANSGVAGESGRIKIGTVGTHTQTTIAGISGQTSASGVAVLVNASGVLGTTTSSVRFKQGVRDMGDSSDVLMKLHPVVFHYREEAVGAEEAKTTQYGLIAEEVAQVAPELVAPDLDGKPYSVKYHELPALLVNEVQKQERTIENQASVIEAQQQEIAALTTRLAQLEARMIDPPSETQR